MGVKGRVVDEWIAHLKLEGSHLLDSTIKLLTNFEVVQSQMQGVKTSLSQEVEDIEKSVTLWGKMEDFRIDILVENKVIPTREKYIQILSLLSHKKETIRSMIMELDQEKKEGDDEIDLISARIAEIPYYLYDDNQNLVTGDAIIQEFLSLIDHCTKQDFTLDAFNKLLEIQVSFGVLVSMLKDGREKYMKVEDIVYRVRAITSSTTMSDKAKMEVVLVKFKEFQKSNEEEKDE